VIGLDTNVLARYIVRDDPRQAAAATRLIEERCTAESPGWVSTIVVCELAWVLQGVYGLTREGIAAVVEAILTSNELQVESADTVWQALRKFRKGPADIADYLIGLTGCAHNAAPTFTFDKRAASDADFRLLE
jgi:predicted nucleic-acid-binding protein